MVTVHQLTILHPLLPSSCETTDELKGNCNSSGLERVKNIKEQCACVRGGGVNWSVVCGGDAGLTAERLIKRSAWRMTWTEA